MTRPMFEHVALVGIGLIGSSISHAARRKGLAGTISGSARTRATVDTALKLKLIDRGYANAAEAVKGADLVILSVPVGACGALAAEIAPHLRPGAILTDVGSVKAAVVRDIAPHVPKGVHFVPGHPIAGTEQSGPEAGFAELFDNRWTILTPEPTDRQGGGGDAQGLLGGARRQGRDHDAGAPRHGARGDEPPAAPDRLQHRQYGRAPRAGDRVRR